MSEKIRCRKCGKEMMSTMKFCGFCAAKLGGGDVSTESVTWEHDDAYVCLDCGEKYDTSYTECKKCGGRINAAGAVGVSAEISTEEPSVTLSDIIKKETVIPSSRNTVPSEPDVSYAPKKTGTSVIITPGAASGAGKKGFKPAGRL